jgi:hypothetical protein
MRVCALSATGSGNLAVGPTQRPNLNGLTLNGPSNSESHIRR